MSKQMEGYYEMLELIEKKYPGRAFLKPKEAAELLGVNIKTLVAAINKRYNALPARNVSSGIKYKSYLIPVTELCRWSVNNR